ncbi:antibiotic biosynthesis monooxygenase [Xylanimonas oleitrophica]|uniref:Antibiotic biosynthesis monooxygenase n=1 Tax=Xylanimonas oleitrophica TaxID=2607479 RepID=A0A2W5Y8X0_9MICO|nr:antibiotic biosynthesis monooxygenase [Xylanimonas oleitrophica]PZR55004.1 antibiotic biosynthesis monooxygenase [Xylanimonas oleitrophica]
MTIGYGFSATMTAHPGRGDELFDVVRSGLDPGSPASTRFCLVYLVSRSASDPDVVHLVEGWTSAEDHRREFDTDAARAIVARFDGLLAKDPEYTDLVPVTGKAVLA